MTSIASDNILYRDWRIHSPNQVIHSSYSMVNISTLPYVVRRMPFDYFWLPIDEYQSISVDDPYDEWQSYWQWQSFSTPENNTQGLGEEMQNNNEVTKSERGKHSLKINIPAHKPLLVQ